MKEAIAIFLTAITTGCSTAYSAATHLVAGSYYPMMSDVAVIDKSQDQSEYFLTVLELEGFRDLATSVVTKEYVFACEKEDYDSVEIGDVINCARMESGLTYRGRDLKIYENLGHMDDLPDGYLYHITPSNKNQ